MWTFRLGKTWFRILGTAFLLGFFVSFAGCGSEQAGVTAPTWLALTSIVANNGVQGANVAVTLTGTGFASGATINMSGTGITVSATSVVSSTQMTATFAIAATASAVAQNVTVTSSGKTTTAVTFTVTGIAPQVSSTNPANLLACEPANAKITATFTKPMNPLTITTATFLVTGVSPVTGTVALDAPNNTAIFAPTANLAFTTTYTATITTSAQDTTGNALASNFSWTFKTCATTDTMAPTVTSTVPANLATAVPVNQKITATFSEGMDSRTLTATTFTLTGPGATAVAGTVTYAGNAGAIATFAPTSSLAVNTLFTATITKGATDLAGNALAAPYQWTFTTGAVADVVSPAVTLTVPASGANGVGINQAVNATFSKAMDPTTISTATFTVVTAGSPVIGTVTYDVQDHIATFTPASSLAANSTYTATISTGAKDLAGNILVSGTIPNPWNFMTGAVAIGPAPVNLGSAATFGDIGGAAGMTNQGIHTVVNGDIGTTGASTLVTGFHDTAGCIYTETTLNVGIVNGSIYTAPPPPTGGPAACATTEGTATTFAIAQQSLADAQTAYNTLAGTPGGADPGAGQLGGLTLPSGVYKAAGGSFLLTGSDLTLDAKGNANSVWIFQMASTLSVGDPGTPRNVILINGAQAKNVFWQVGSAATINAAGGGTMEGTIIAFSGVSFSTAGNAAIATLNGRALGLNASVTVVNTVINVPAP
jgi:ice-binding like protein/Big-like domain-containing protein